MNAAGSQRVRTANDAHGAEIERLPVQGLVESQPQPLVLELLADLRLADVQLHDAVSTKADGADHFAFADHRVFLRQQRRSERLDPPAELHAAVLIRLALLSAWHALHFHPQALLSLRGRQQRREVGRVGSPKHGLASGKRGHTLVLLVEAIERRLVPGRALQGHVLVFLLRLHSLVGPPALLLRRVALRVVRETELPVRQERAQRVVDAVLEHVLLVGLREAGHCRPVHRVSRPWRGAFDVREEGTEASAAPRGALHLPDVSPELRQRFSVNQRLTSGTRDGVLDAGVRAYSSSGLSRCATLSAWVK